MKDKTEEFYKNYKIESICDRLEKIIIKSKLEIASLYYNSRFLDGDILHSIISTNKNLNKKVDKDLYLIDINAPKDLNKYIYLKPNGWSRANNLIELEFYFNLFRFSKVNIFSLINFIGHTKSPCKYINIINILKIYNDKEKDSIFKDREVIYEILYNRLNFNLSSKSMTNFISINTIDNLFIKYNNMKKTMDIFYDVNKDFSKIDKRNAELHKEIKKRDIGFMFTNISKPYDADINYNVHGMIERLLLDIYNHICTTLEYLNYIVDKRKQAIDLIEYTLDTLENNKENINE